MTPKKRKGNFTDQDLTLFLNELEQHPELLRRNYDITSEEQRAAWDHLARVFNSNSNTSYRSAGDLRQKYADLKARTKKKLGIIVNSKTKKKDSKLLTLSENEKRVIDIASIRVKRNPKFPAIQSSSSSESTFNVTESLPLEIQNICSIVKSEPKTTDQTFIKVEYGSDIYESDGDSYTNLMPEVSHRTFEPIESPPPLHLFEPSTITNNILHHESEQKSQTQTSPGKPLRNPLRKRHKKIKPVSRFQREMLQIARRKIKCQEETNGLLRELIDVLKIGTK